MKPLIEHALRYQQTGYEEVFCVLAVSIQEVTSNDVRTLFATREESIVRDVLWLIARRLPELVEQEGEEDEDAR